MITDVELLTKVCEAADMGRDSINQVKGLTDNQPLNSALEQQCKEYDNIYNRAESILQEQGRPPKNSGAFAKVNSRIQVNLQTTLTDNVASKLADMVIKGSTMGVTKITKQLHAYDGSNQAAKEVAQQLIQTEESNISEMKQFL